MRGLLPTGASRLDLVSLISRNSSDWFNLQRERERERGWALHNLTHPVFRDEHSGISREGRTLAET